MGHQKKWMRPRRGALGPKQSSCGHGEGLQAKQTVTAAMGQAKKVTAATERSFKASKKALAATGRGFRQKRRHLRPWANKKRWLRPRRGALGEKEGACGHGEGPQGKNRKCMRPWANEKRWQTKKGLWPRGGASGKKGSTCGHGPTKKGGCGGFRANKKGPAATVRDSGNKKTPAAMGQ